MGVSRATIVSWKKHEKTKKLDRLQKYGRYLQTDWPWLMNIFHYFWNFAKFWVLPLVLTDSGQPTLCHQLMFAFHGTLAFKWALNKRISTSPKLLYQL